MILLHVKRPYVWHGLWLSLGPLDVTIGVHLNGRPYFSIRWYS